jgi:hypothetical protein
MVEGRGIGELLVISRLFEAQLVGAQVELLEIIAENVADGSWVDSVLFWRAVARIQFLVSEPGNGMSLEPFTYWVFRV